MGGLEKVGAQVGFRETAISKKASSNPSKLRMLSTIFFGSSVTLASDSRDTSIISVAATITARVAAKQGLRNLSKLFQ